VCCSTLIERLFTMPTAAMSALNAINTEKTTIVTVSV
jgi:hypothetical protein